uniref:Uncharacterized protein n=1 Tax=Glossina pallidipes TaxID=7398 RepID=A0A1B0ABI7_GLOPL
MAFNATATDTYLLTYTIMTPNIIIGTFINNCRHMLLTHMKRGHAMDSDKFFKVQVNATTVQLSSAACGAGPNDPRDVILNSSSWRSTAVEAVFRALLQNATETTYMTCFKIRLGIKRRWMSGHDLILSEPYDDQVDYRWRTFIIRQALYCCCQGLSKTNIPKCTLAVDKEANARCKKSGRRDNNENVSSLVYDIIYKVVMENF